MRPYYIVYTSVAAAPMHEAELRDILEHARASNHQTRITGLLLYSNGQILQVLEGEQKAVEKLYEKIQRDPRHTHVATVDAGFGEHRIFPDWSMGFGVAAGPEYARLAGYVDSSRGAFLLPRAHNAPPNLRQLMREFVTNPNAL